MAAGKQVGLAEGRKAGKQVGRQVGLAEGMEAGRKTIVVNMIKRGMSDEDIMALAECGQEFVDQLRNEINM